MQSCLNISLKHSFAIIRFAAVVGGNMTVEGVVGSCHGQGLCCSYMLHGIGKRFEPLPTHNIHRVCSGCKEGHQHSQNLNLATQRERALTGSCSCCMEGNSSGAIQGSVPRMFPLTKVAAFFLDSPRSPILTTGLFRSLKSHSRLSHFRSKWTTRRECKYSIPGNKNKNKNKNNNNNDNNETAFQLVMS